MNRKKILVLNGPNLQLLGTRNPKVYGATTLDMLHEQLNNVAKELDIELVHFQSNSEGDIVTKIGNTKQENIAGMIINPAAYTHTSIAIRDAIEAVEIPTIEVHISNIHAREAFRQHSMIAPVAIAQIAGVGCDGYEWGLRALNKYLSK
jgi:3-dehydroquinate dehydratase-2